MTELPLVKLPHFVTVEDLSSEQVLSLIHRAEFYKDGGETPKLTKPVYVTNAFFENSTEGDREVLVHLFHFSHYFIWIPSMEAQCLNQKY